VLQSGYNCIFPTLVTEYECCKVADAILERVANLKRARAMMAKRARAEAKRDEE
jgi:hypothetical protein